MHKMVHLYHMADIPLIVHRPYEIQISQINLVQVCLTQRCPLK